MRISLIRYLLFALILVLSGLDLIAQGNQTDRDFETWSSVTLFYKPVKKLRIGLNVQIRLKDNSSTIDVYFTQLSLRYALPSDVSLVAAGRFIRENDDVGKIQGYENHFRWHADLRYKNEIDRLELKYRLRYQSKDELGITTDAVRSAWRFRLGASYNIRKWKWDPTLTAEIFNGLTFNDGPYKMRYTLGTEYKTKDLGTFGLFYRMERSMRMDPLEITDIAGFNYEYTLKRKNDKN